MPVTPPVDKDFLLGRIDGKVDGIALQLQTIISRADSHETRLTGLEATQAAVVLYIEQHKTLMTKVDNLEGWKSEITGAVRMTSIMKAALAVIAACIIYLGYKVDLEPASTVQQVRTTQQVQQVRTTRPPS